MAAVLAGLAVLGAACGGPSAPEGVTPPDGHAVEVVSDALTGPTQVVRGADGRLWVAELNGGESDGTGRVVALADDGSIADVLLDGLDKPTGIVVAGGALWVMQADTLGRAPLDGDDLPGQLAPVLEDLPNNGRSETSLSTTAEGDVVFGITGTERDVDASGYLATMAADGTGEPHVVATGLKNAYAHVATATGFVSTEIGDGNFDDGPPRDELVALADGDDAGWPRCTGDRDPSEDRGATAADCAETVAPLATFEPRATPTGLAAFDGGWVVTLWTRGELVRVPTDGGDPVVWASGLEGPQHLLAEGDTLWLTEHLTGRLLAFRPR